jgi:lipopolysaccharide biosynthesis glycosyltransferase
MNINIQIFNFTTIFQAACARLFIFEYPKINQYEKILYLDTDIILKADITPIFHLEISDLLYGIESGTIGTFSFGAQFFDLSKISEATPGINSGTLLFKNSQIIRDLFSRIRNHINEFTESGQKIPYCMDQPFINYHAIKDSLYDNSLLNSHVSLFEGNDEVNNYETSSVCHFSFPIGNFGHKYARMKKFLDKIIGIRNTPGALMRNHLSNSMKIMP